jgi:hypothetical protein
LTIVYLRLEPGDAAPARRHAQLERLLAAADPADPIDDWRLDAQRLLQPSGSEVMQAAPVAWCDAMAGVAPPPAGSGGPVFLAQPLHTEATLSSVRLPPHGLLRIGAAEARQLAAQFSALPAAGATGQPRLVAAGTRLFFCFDVPLDARGSDPATLLGFDLRDFRPTGSQARRLEALSSEVEMWLFEHEVNRARRERGEPVITTLWPWGGGAMRAHLPPPGFAVHGEDVLFGAWARSVPPAGDAQNGLIVCPQSIDPDELDAVLAPRLASLRPSMLAGRGALHVSAGRRRCTLRRMPRRWFARRAGPWWEHFDESE